MSTRSHSMVRTFFCGDHMWLHIGGADLPMYDDRGLNHHFNHLINKNPLSSGKRQFLPDCTRFEPCVRHLIPLVRASFLLEWVGSLLGPSPPGWVTKNKIKKPLDQWPTS